ncbi:hypothetical protein EB796_015368 [Bugula neritina]|uniref:B box-type domain-containing protein n=1 Tax=Bugula neritina TaxID=10212 RepID=A0A7J7JJ25_BUGNE|nr:hypothetical protein EB796_015368 [Bugula neritina]
MNSFFYLVCAGEPLTVILDADLEFLSEVYNFHVTGNTLIVRAERKSNFGMQAIGHVAALHWLRAVLTMLVRQRPASSPALQVWYNDIILSSNWFTDLLDTVYHGIIEVFDVELESLPTPDTKEPPLCCDSCTRKGVDNQLAVVYCTTCSAKLCAKHREFHDEVHDNHPMVRMTNYRAQAKRVTPRLCAQHEEMVYTLGCKSCLTVACTECVGALSSCTHDPLSTPHTTVDLISRYKETENVISQLMSENVSLPEVPSITTLQVKDERREIEVEVVTSQDGQTTPNALHKQLILQHTAKTSGTPVSVCSYQGKVYVGSYGGVEVVAENKLLSEKLICPYQTSIYGVAAHRDRLYISTHQNSNYLETADGDLRC